MERLEQFSLNQKTKEERGMGLEQVSIESEEGKPSGWESIEDVDNSFIEGVKEIEAGSHLPPEEIKKVRDRFGLEDFFKSLRTKAHALLYDMGFNQGPTETVSGPEYDKRRESLDLDEAALDTEMLLEAQEQVVGLLENRGLLSLSAEDFKKYFSDGLDFENDPELRQGNTGNCGLIAAIYAMSRSPQFETICRSSMKRLPNGNWEVKVPFLDQAGNTVTITQEEIDMQGIKDASQDQQDDVKLLRPMNAAEGFRVIEAAFTKNKFGAVDRRAAESRTCTSLSDLFGDMYYEMKPYGENREDLQQYKLPELKERGHAFLDHYLDTFDPATHLGTLGVNGFIGRSFLGKFRIQGTSIILPGRHAYAISSVDKNAQTVSIVNPWDTSEKISLSYDQIKKYFGLDVGRINNAKLLSNLKEVGEIK